MRIDDMAGYMVSEGKEIIIDRQTGSRDDDIRVFFCSVLLWALF